MFKSATFISMKQVEREGILGTQRGVLEVCYLICGRLTWECPLLRLPRGGC